jgi:hypothetical protein
MKNKLLIANLNENHSQYVDFRKAPLDSYCHMLIMFTSTKIEHFDGSIKLTCNNVIHTERSRWEYKYDSKIFQEDIDI